jgi:hypothetical protein
VRIRFVELARTPDPPGVRSNIGSATDPVVVALALDGPQPLVGLEQGSGHLGSGGAFPIGYVLAPDGQLESFWVDHFARAGATWVLPYLRGLLAGGRLSETELVTAYRQRHGRDPVVTVQEVARAEVTAEQLWAERRQRQRALRRGADGPVSEPPGDDR